MRPPFSEDHASTWLYGGVRARLALMGLTVALSAALFHAHAVEVFSRAAGHEYNSYVILAPFVSMYFIYENRKKIAAEAKYDLAAGVALMIAGLIAYAAVSEISGFARDGDRDSAFVFSMLVFVTGGFLAFFGKKAMRESAFAFVFLLFAVPVPETLLDLTISFLQKGSAEVSWFLFRLSGAPVVRESEFTFKLPGMGIEIARQCSGIRSSLALLITAVLAGHIYLKTNLAKASLLSFTVPVAIVKNALRITVLTLSGFYIDDSVLSGPLHSRGGIPFFILGLAAVFSALMVLRKIERARGQKKTAARGSESPEQPLS